MSEAVAHGGDGGALAQAKAQLHALSRLQRRVADASPGSLVSIRNEVTASVAATQALAQQSSPSSTPSFQSAQVALQQASEAARSTTKQFMHDFYDRHVFDSYLKFTSGDDEEEYRRRAEERKHAIEKAMAEHTPEGDLRAANLSLDQLNDAGAHGADKSAAFNGWKKAITERRDNLASVIDQQQHSADATKTVQPDPLKDVKPDQNASPEALAGLRAAGVVIAPEGEGHGVTAASGQSTAIGRH